MRLLLIAAMLPLLATAAARADDCAGFKWNLAREYALYAGTPTREKASTSAATPPALKVDTLYEITLMPQGEVSYALPPGKKMLTDGAFGGVVSFTVPAAGDYRIGLDVPFWIDVVSDGTLLRSKDFGGPQGCAKPPHKLVEFELKGGTRYLLQFSGQTQSSAHVSIVESEPSKR